MDPLLLHQFHAAAGARFEALDQLEVVWDYGDFRAEHNALRETVGVLDLSFRGRLCLTGEDRLRFLHGQVTNDVKALQIGQGCYAALITAKGKMISDLNIYRLANEVLLDFDHGLTEKVKARLEQYVIADDVQALDAAPYYGLLSLQGPRAAQTLTRLALNLTIPGKPMDVTAVPDPDLGEIYVAHLPRIGTSGFDLFVPVPALAEVAQRLQNSAVAEGGRFCGWHALEAARIEAGIPRFGADMDESNLPPEAGLEARAISYSKGCYIGQEVLARIRTYGKVAKTLRGLQLADDLPKLPKKGDRLFKEEKEVGFITSALASPAYGRNIALGYVRREANSPGSELLLQVGEDQSVVRIVNLPFAQNFS